MMRRSILLAVLWLILLAPFLARGATADTVTLNFVNADIDGVVKALSEMTGKNFVLDARVKGVVNIVSAKPVSRALAYDVFLAALRLQGFAAVEDRGIVKIVPESEAKLHQSPMLGPQDKLQVAGDRMQTQVFSLKYESAAQLVPTLRPLIAPNNTITANQTSNSLVITDYASNLQRLEKIIEALDQPSNSDPVIISLNYASALDVAQTINRLFTETGQAGQPADASQRLLVVADPRSNKLLARSSGDPSRLARLRQFVAMLDTPTSAAGNIHVLHLKNAEAAKLAETLRAIHGGEASAGAGSRPAATSPLGASANLGAAPTATASSPGIIQADTSTNSIIITAPDAIYNNLRAVVEKLDTRRVQVYVEALIAEVTADRAAEFGIQWQKLGGLAKSGSQSFGGTNFGGSGQNIISIAQNPGAAGQGLNLGIINGSVTLPGIGAVLDLGVLVRALETDANANILSTPTLLTLDNEEARIVIGQNVPFITGQYAVSGTQTTPTPFQTVERRDVGLTLKIKPQISEGGTVRLQIYQEVSSIQDSTNLAGVITNKRSIESTVLVDDGQIVVLGGLMQDQVNDGMNKVPLLGDIPGVGTLFRYGTREHKKTNLMVFLRPTLLRDTKAADALASGRYDYIVGEQGKVKQPPGLLLHDTLGPELPPRAAPTAVPAAAAAPQ